MKKWTMLGMAAAILALFLAGQGWAYELLTGPTGMIYHDDSKAYEGCTLYTPEGGTHTYLVDMEGQIVHTWPPLGNPMLLENGDIFGIYGDRHAYGDLVLMDWNGNIKQRWEAPQDFRPNEFTDADPINPQGHPTLFHHDWKVIEGSPHVPAGEKSVIAIARVGRLEEEIEAAGFEASTGGFGAIELTNPATGESVSYSDTDAILEFDMDGNLVWYWEFWDHIFQTRTPAASHYYGLSKEEDQAENPNPFDRMYFRKEHHSSIGGDTNHSNAIDYNPVRQEVLINPVRSASFYVVRFDTSIEGARGPGGDFIYRWGDPSQYDVNAVPSGIATHTNVSRRSGTTTRTTYGKHDSMIGGSHDVQWIDEGLPGAGNLLIFSNAGTPYLDGGSAVVEVNPYTDDAFLNPDTNWRHDPYVPQDFGTDEANVDQELRSVQLGGSNRNTADFSKQMVMCFSPQYAFGQYEKAGFFSGHISGCQRLPNGNTLVCSGESGHFFEITKPEKFANTELGLDLMIHSEGRFPFDEEDCFTVDLLYRQTEVAWEFVNPFCLPRENIVNLRAELAEYLGETYTPEGEIFEHRPAGVDGQVYRCLRYGYDFPGFEDKCLAPLGDISDADEWQDKTDGDFSWMFGIVGGGGGSGAGGATGGIGGGAGY